MSESLRRPLLEAAYRVIGKKGASGLTLDAVAAEAGASKGGVLYHFRSKGALFEAMLRDVVEECDREIERHLRDEPVGEPGGEGDVDGGGEPGRFVRAYIRASTCKVDEAEEEMGSAILAAIAADPTWARVYWPAVERWRERAVNDGLDPGLALALLFAADGLSICEALGIGEGRKELRQRTIDQLLRLTRLPAKDGGAGGAEARSAGKDSVTAMTSVASMKSSKSVESVESA